MVYEHGIITVDIETRPSIPLEAPLVHQQAGRPMVNRIRRQDEDRPKWSILVLCAVKGGIQRQVRTSTTIESS